MQQNQPAILVIGAGSWGTALAILLAHNQHPVYLWGNDPAQLEKMQQSRCNTTYLPNLNFPEKLQITFDLSKTLAQAQTLLIAVPSHAFRAVMTQIKPHLHANHQLIWATKGLEHQDNQQHLFLHQVAHQVIGKDYPLAVISGPTFAAEVAEGKPTAMTLAAVNIDYAETMAQLFRNDHFRVYTSQDLIGVQLGGAAKNVIAIAAGVADGLQLGANTRAALITRGLHEIMQLGLALGGKAETLMGLSGVGDLVLTCTDNQSRNRRFGLALGQGKSVQAAEQSIGQVVEGKHVVTQLNEIAQQVKVEMPLTSQVYELLQGHCTAQQAAHQLLTRHPKAE